MNGPIVSLVDGQPADALPVTDSAVLRGDGCFEAVRSYGGHLFRLDDHLDRLEASAAALGLAAPARALLKEWSARVVGQRRDCMVRIVLTRGPAVAGASGAGRCIVMSHPLVPSADEVRLWPVQAPWHPAGRQWELAGVKTISYAPNQAATRLAIDAGFHDALLVSDDGVVLEGPTFSVGWVRDGVVVTPALSLGILASITRRVVTEVATVDEVVADLAELALADEVFVMSTAREVAAVTAVGDRSYAAGPVTGALRQRVAEEVSAAAGAQASSALQPR